MAIVLEANYAKKLGLPGYSSHQYSVSIRTELTELSQVEAECDRLYSLLQNAVDESIQHVGFMPDACTYGTANNGAQPTALPGRNSHQANGSWRCSEKQRELIEKVVCEHSLDKNDVEQIAQDMFGIGVKQLNRLQASGLINELLERCGGSARKHGKSYVNGNGHVRPDLANCAAQARVLSKPAAGGHRP